MEINNTKWNKIRYSIYAPFYNIIKGLFTHGRKRSIELLAIKPGEKVLLVGVGTGLDFEHLPTEANITAIDLTPAMVEQARKKALSLGLPVDFQVMNAEQLSFDAEQFDVVIMHLILAVIPNPLACAQEAKRVLKTGGRVSVFDKFLTDGATPPLFRRMMNVITNTFFSDINRQLGPITAAAGLNTTHHEPSIFGGAFTITLLTK